MFNVGRYGGDEFIVVLTKINIEETRVLEECNWKTIENLWILHVGSLISRVVTISFSSASIIPTDGVGSEQIVHLAEEDFYKEKIEGRNRDKNFSKSN